MWGKNGKNALYNQTREKKSPNNTLEPEKVWDYSFKTWLEPLPNTQHSC